MQRRTLVCFSLALGAACSSSKSSITSSGSGAGGSGTTSSSSTESAGSTNSTSASSGGGTASTSTSSTGTSSSSSASSTSGSSGTGGSMGASRGFPVAGPWVSWYGDATGVDLAQVASTFRVINIDADPDAGNFTDADLTTMRAGGKNVVLSYMNVGSCENYRSYWSTDPPGHKSCVSSGALTTAYGGYPDEKWADLSNAAYHDLIVNYVAVRLAARPIDGFYLDNLEVVEHSATASDGPCTAACSQGGLDLVWELRQKFPSLLIVMQNASSKVTRLGTTHGVPYPSVLDGLSHEEVYSNGGDSTSLAEMKAWKTMDLMPGGRPFWLAVEEYVGACSTAAKPSANAIYTQAASDGFNCYVTDASGSQAAPCFWSKL